MLDPKNAIKTETKLKSDGGKRYIYTFVCAHPDCSNHVKARKDVLKNSSGLCKMHAQRKKPFESLYNCLMNDWRGFTNTLSYEEFLLFTNINSCHYCLSEIKWVPFSTIEGKFTTRAYFLDRKNCELGYSLTNCVVCCTKCNIARGNRYTYEEWFGMTQYLRNLANL